MAKKETETKKKAPALPKEKEAPALPKEKEAPAAPAVMEEEKRVDVVSENGAIVQYVFFSGKSCRFNVVCVNQAAIDRVAYFQDSEVGRHVYENDCLPNEPEPEEEEESEENV